MTCPKHERRRCLGTTSSKLRKRPRTKVACREWVVKQSHADGKTSTEVTTSAWKYAIDSSREASNQKGTEELLRRNTTADLRAKHAQPSSDQTLERQETTSDRATRQNSMLARSNTRRDERANHSTCATQRDAGFSRNACAVHSQQLQVNNTLCEVSVQITGSSSQVVVHVRSGTKPWI